MLDIDMHDHVFTTAKPHRRICGVYGGIKGDEENQANARLISAAPDLLEACLGALRIQSLWYPVASDNDDECAALNSMRKKFESAIAKALGES